MSKSVMNNNTMTTHLPPNQSLDTDLSAQEPSMSNKVLKNNESSDAKPLETDDRINAETVSDGFIADDTLSQASEGTVSEGSVSKDRYRVSCRR